MSISEEFLKLLNFYKGDLISDIGRLVAIPSVRNVRTKGKNMPFGKEIRRAFDLIKEIAEGFSLKCEDFNGYALHIDYGDSEKTMGILTHADVVPAADISNWDFEPFALNIRNGLMYGRGVNDDKASIIGTLYIMRILKELGYKPSKKIRLIVGGAEETTWECMNYYLRHNIAPDICFSPDCDFPVVNCEKGILYGEITKNMKVPESSIHCLVSLQSEKRQKYVLNNLEVKIRTADFLSLEKCAKNASSISFDGTTAFLTYTAAKNVSRNPHRGPHAACGLLEDFYGLASIDNNFRNILEIIQRWFPKEPFGKALGIAFNHEETGRLTLALCCISYINEELLMDFDIRYPAGIEEEEILSKLYLESVKESFRMQILESRKRLYVPSDSFLVTTLLDAYEAVMKERPLPVTKGGASYSRAVPNCVGFGPTFAGEIPNSHKENECMNIESLFKALSIYFEAIIRL